MIYVLRRDADHPGIWRIDGVKEFPNELIPSHANDVKAILRNAATNLKRIEQIKFGEIGRNRKDDA